MVLVEFRKNNILYYSIFALCCTPTSESAEPLPVAKHSGKIRFVGLSGMCPRKRKLWPLWPNQPSKTSLPRYIEKYWDRSSVSCAERYYGVFCVNERNKYNIW